MNTMHPYSLRGYKTMGGQSCGSKKLQILGEAVLNLLNQM